MDKELKTLLNNFSPEVQELAILVRKRILKIAPDSNEKIYEG